MKIKRFLAVACAATMAIGMTACSGGAAGNGGATKKDASIDFEDGNFGFAVVSTASAANNPAVLSVQDYNDSKVLYAAANQESGSGIQLAIDLGALLGDKVSSVASMQMDIGTHHSTFAAISGTIYGNFGANTNQTLSTISIYMEDDNPKTYTLDLSTQTITAGESNYIVIAKETDNGTDIGDLFVDNILFLDADGKKIEADSSATHGLSDLVVDWSQVSGDIIALDSSYPGDWCITTVVVTPDDLAKYTETGAKVRFDFQVNSGYDYYLFNPCTGFGADSWMSVMKLEEKTHDEDSDTWTKTGKSFAGYAGIEPISEAVEGEIFHLQTDGFYVLSDWDAAYIEFLLTPEQVVECAKQGGLTGQTYGLTATACTLDTPNDDEKALIDAKSASFNGDGSDDAAEDETKDPGYLGDWAAATEDGCSVNVDELPAGGCKVTVDCHTLSGYDPVQIKPMDCTSGWNALQEFITENTVEFNENGQGFFIIPDGTTQFSFVISADGVAAMDANASVGDDGVKWGGLGFQVNGIVVDNVTVEAI